MTACYCLKDINKDESSVVLFCASELENCTGRKPKDLNLKLFIRQKPTPLLHGTLRHTYQTKGLPQRTHNSFALDSRALLYFIASFVSIYCFVWWPFFIVLLTIWHYWIGTSIGLFCRLLGHYVKPVWSSYPHCSFGHDCSAHRLDWVPLSCSLYGAWWALAYGPYGPPGPPHLVDSCQKQNPGYTFISHFFVSRVDSFYSPKHKNV